MDDTNGTEAAVDKTLCVSTSGDLARKAKSGVDGVEEDTEERRQAFADCSGLWEV